VNAPAVSLAALAASAFGLLDARGSLRLITDTVDEDDALCLALVCRALRDVLWARFPRRPAGECDLLHDGTTFCRAGCHSARRVRTRDAAVVGSVARLS
jgi:hypothetical protein